jgi:hypothetical protein
MEDIGYVEIGDTVKIGKFEAVCVASDDCDGCAFENELQGMKFRQVFNLAQESLLRQWMIFVL